MFVSLGFYLFRGKTLRRFVVQGARYGYIWAGSNLACVVFFYFFIPEMKRRSLEELDEIFAARVSARKFSSYHCLIGEAARIDAVNAQGRKHNWEM